MDTRHLRHNTDPVTSHIAAEQTETFRARHIATIYAALQKGPMTAQQIADATGLDYVAVNRRTAEMNERKLIRRTGETRPNRAGRKCCVWVAI